MSKIKERIIKVADVIFYTIATIASLLLLGLIFVVIASLLEPAEPTQPIVESSITKTTKPITHTVADNLHDRELTSQILLIIAEYLNQGNKLYWAAGLQTFSLGEGLTNDTTKALALAKTIKAEADSMEQVTKQLAEHIKNNEAKSALLHGIDKMTEGLHWQSNYYRDQVQAFKASGANAIQPVRDKYSAQLQPRDIMLMGSLQLLRAKKTLGMPETLTEFREVDAGNNKPTEQ